MALGGLKDVITGETLCDEKAPIMLERMEFPDPVIKVQPPPHPPPLPHAPRVCPAPSSLTHFIHVVQSAFGYSASVWALTEASRYLPRDCLCRCPSLAFYNTRAAFCLKVLH